MREHLPYPSELQVPRPVALATGGGTAAAIAVGSGVVRDHPPFQGQTQARQLLVDIDAGRAAERSDTMVLAVPNGRVVRDDLRLHQHLVPYMLDAVTYGGASAHGAGHPAEAYLAGVNEYLRLWTAFRTMTRTLARVFGNTPDGVVVLLLVFWIGRATGSGLAPILLQLAQRAQDDLAQMGVRLERYVLLTVPALMDELHLDMWRRALATLALLAAAHRHGLPVAPGQVLRGPLAEGPIFVHGAPVGVVPSLDAHNAQAAALVRAIADPGPLGTALRGRVRQAAGAPLRGGGAHIFKAIGMGSLLVDPATAELLVDISEWAAYTHAPPGAEGVI